MKKLIPVLLLATCCALGSLVVSRLLAADEKSFQSYEYATIRWAGRDNTHLIRPNGQVEMLGPLLARVKRPDRVDERALLMNIAMNAIAREGYEFAGMADDVVVMKRAVGK